jgi:succinate dehydrogenase/fumarate reductase cytochrome b subunit
MHGYLNHATTSSKRNRAIVFVVQSMTGVASSYIFQYSITMIMYLAPAILSFGLIGPINSMAHLSNAYNVTCECKGI